jgi:hypothetical protein
VTVDNGKATLTGEVDTWCEHWAAIENAFEEDATSVISYLEIKETPGSEDYARYYDHLSDSFE